MNKLLNWKFLLLAIVIIAACLRLYHLGTNPPSLTWDETSWGYNAYSIGIDGKDEFGRFLPLDYLESFGDFKPPMYAYLDVIPVKILGLNEFAVRLPSALFGTLTVLFTFLLVKRIFYKSKDKEKHALITSFILAISPWHVLLSRAAFEANVANFFIVVGVWSFLAAIQEKKWFLLISAVSFALSMYTFNTARIVSPLLVLTLALFFRNKLWEIRKEVAVSIILGLLILLPTAKFLLSPQAQLRFKEVNIFSDPTVITTSNQQVANDNNAFWSKILHNRRLIFATEYLKHYFDHFNPQFLFIKGDGNPKFSTQTNGQMYIWDLPFFIAGILFIIRKKEKNWWFVPLWLLLAIVPAATARETPHALRIESALPTFQILTAYGVVSLLEIFRKYKKQFVVIILIALFANFSYFLHDYFVHYPKDYSGEWQYGYKESIDFVDKNKDKFDKIFITDSLGRPYIYYLYYLKTDPEEFRKEARIKRDTFGFVTVESFGKYYFSIKNSEIFEDSSNNLYINDIYNVPSNAKILKTFYLLNGKPVLNAYTL